MKVLFITSEAAPFAKSGGLGDVAGSLPEALNTPGTSCRVVMPLYGSIAPKWRDQMEHLTDYYVTLGWRSIFCGVYTLKYGNTVFYFLDNESYFKRDGLYGHFDDGERYAFFSAASVELIHHIDWMPDLLHCNDWQTALVPVYLSERVAYGDEALRDVKTLFTIHNIEYQGRYSRSLCSDLFGLHSYWVDSGRLEFDGDINLMKGAMLTASAVSTVSPTYANELGYPYFAYGLDGVVGMIRDRFSGILNGIDVVSYDPANDTEIAANYSSADLSGKAVCKEALQRELGLDVDPNVPIVACVGRLVGHKGMDLVLARLEAMLEFGVQFVILGTGEHGFEQFFRSAEQRNPGKVAAAIRFSEALAHRIYAGSDIFLMPSQKEPCGLSQMIAMRYGTIPVVRETGGLKDTVAPYNRFDSTGAGFSFENYNADDMAHVIWLAVQLYRDNPGEWKRMMQRDLDTDFSWTKSAGEYKALYRKITGKR